MAAAFATQPLRRQRHDLHCPDTPCTALPAWPPSLTPCSSSCRTLSQASSLSHVPLQLSSSTSVPPGPSRSRSPSSWSWPWLLRGCRALLSRRLTRPFFLGAAGSMDSSHLVGQQGGVRCVYVCVCVWGGGGVRMRRMCGTHTATCAHARTHAHTHTHTHTLLQSASILAASPKQCSQQPQHAGHPRLLQTVASSCYHSWQLLVMLMIHACCGAMLAAVQHQ
jgi:hypothetical protein